MGVPSVFSGDLSSKLLPKLVRSLNGSLFKAMDGLNKKLISSIKKLLFGYLSAVVCMIKKRVRFLALPGIPC